MINQAHNKNRAVTKKKLNQSNKYFYIRLSRKLLEAKKRLISDSSTCTERAKHIGTESITKTSETSKLKMDLMYNQAKQLKKVAIQLVFQIAKVKT